jgi:hypothetical protein
MDQPSQASPGPNVEELEARMRPGAFSQLGFLGPHERLGDVLTRDAETVRILGVTCEAIAERLKTLIEHALDSPRKRARVQQHFDVSLEQYKGFQICPWSSAPHQRQCDAGLGVQFASLDWDISNRQAGLHMRGPGLAVHLIRDHHFFEGLGTPYRLDPAALVRLLEVPGK